MSCTASLESGTLAWRTTLNPPRNQVVLVDEPRPPMGTEATVETDPMPDPWVLEPDEDDPDDDDWTTL